MADIEAEFRKPFAEQIAAFRLRLANLVPTAKWDDISHAQHDRAFMVAGAMKADLLADLAAAVDKAVSQGTSLQEFRRDFRQIVETRGWHGWTGEGTKAGRAWRTRVIYRTNMSTSYAAGRMAQLVEEKYDFWVYRHGASLEPRLQHIGWDGLILSPDHPFWVQHAPPNGWGCSCYVVGADSEAGAVRLGGKPGMLLPDGWNRIDPKSGAQVGIDKGWGYSPGASVANVVAQDVALLASKIATLPPELGTAFGLQNAKAIKSGWNQWVKETVDGTSHEPGFLGVLGQDVIEALGMRDMKPVTGSISVKPGLVAGPKAARHEKMGNALSDANWADLPDMIRTPLAVLRDEKTGKLLYVLPDETGVAQIAVELDFVYTAQRQKGVTNMVVSAYRAKLSDLIWRLARGEITLLTGSLQG